MTDRPRVLPAVHIGYHKTGTSWFQESVLPHHPSLVPFGQSRQPWDDDFVAYVVTTPDRCFDADQARQRFDRRIAALNNAAGRAVVVSAERLSGHPASGGYDSFRIAQRLRAVVPEARIFLLVRNQLDAIESTYKQLLGEGYTGRVADLFAAPRWKTVGFDLGHYEYDALAQEYVELFGRAQVAVFGYEAACADPGRFLDRLCRFLAVEPAPLAPALLRDRVHPSFPNRGLALVRALNHIRASDLNPHPPLDIGSGFRRPLALLLRLLPDRARILSEPERAALRQRYRASNERLGDLLDELDRALLEAGMVAP